MKQRKFEATYRRRNNGWSAVVEGDPPVTGFGRTLSSARIDLVNQLSDRHHILYTGGIVVQDSIDLASPAQESLSKARRARNQALEAIALSNAATADAAVALTAGGLSLRDVGYLLGLSHGRVQQLLGAIDGSRPSQRPKKRKVNKGAGK